jgi:tRNA nucleotidyltransferase (CCA-adding enzyme)
MVNFKISQHLIHPQATEICRILHAHGHQAYIVGGCVRDLLLSVKPKDWDITTDANPTKIMELFPKTYPTGLQHGTITVAMGEGIDNHFEVTTFRIEGEYKDGRRPEEVFFVMDVEQDLARRDLTINAIAYDPIEGRLVDPFGGILDLQSGIIRAVGNPEARFREDGLRIMRVARFAARFGYQVKDDTFNAMQANLETLKKVSKERVQDELCKTLMTMNPAYGFLLLNQSGALSVVCPLLTSHPPYLHFMSYLDKCQGELETRLAFLYGNCTVVDTQQELMSLKFSNKEIKKTLFLLELLDRYGVLAQRDTALAYKSFMAALKNHSPDPWQHTLEQFIQLIEAMEIGSRTWFDKYQQEIVFMKKEMQINGDDLMAVGIKPGPEIKKILDDCYLEILRNPSGNTKSHLLKFAMGM